MRLDCVVFILQGILIGYFTAVTAQNHLGILQPEVPIKNNPIFTLFLKCFTNMHTLTHRSLDPTKYPLIKATLQQTVSIILMTLLGRHVYTFNKIALQFNMPQGMVVSSGGQARVPSRPSPIWQYLLRQSEVSETFATIMAFNPFVNKFCSLFGLYVHMPGLSFAFQLMLLLLLARTAFFLPTFGLLPLPRQLFIIIVYAQSGNAHLQGFLRVLLHLSIPHESQDTRRFRFKNTPKQIALRSP